MNKRDIVLSLCSLLLGVTLGASSIMYAQGVPTRAFRGERLIQTVPHRAPANERTYKYGRRSLRQAEKNALKKASGTQQ